MIVELFILLGATAYAIGASQKRQAQAGGYESYLKRKNIDKKRQQELMMMIDSYYPCEREEFDRLLGRHFDRRLSYYDRERAVKEILEKEGKGFYDIRSLPFDPMYKDCVHIKDKKR